MDHIYRFNLYFQAIWPLMGPNIRGTNKKKQKYVPGTIRYRGSLKHDGI